ncbi:GNAT family N-acetyltransferase [Streptacidiphilus sp. P02-A3a]|uniref:GNAT family N-acetyltransferase n=1 Tax=Streptacidiphilus sp. P02-A3a TaxID=2704468 RepID=UPI0015FB89EF|nr:GNAT family N-acetyltransferase [Streptacidiphilus sp. P02-A3a]QMU67599.1 GNAT family N-acetyltransferase [Streptacidiphilus sp. P02-A3a]
MRIKEVPWSDPAGEALRRDQRNEIAEVYGTPDSESGAPSGPDIAVFVVAYADDGTPVGCAGLRLLGEDSAELKRMYVVPAQRGTGVAAELLRALEASARARGLTTLRLETGDRLHAAHRFYTRSGFTPIPNYGPYVDSDTSLCFERRLQPTA